MRFQYAAALCTFLLSSLVSAQLSGPVGPTTSTASKRAKKVCNVLNYGAVANKSKDIGPPLAAAWIACRTGGIVYIPPGDYAMATWVTLNGGTGVGIQLDGIIYRTGNLGGTMLVVQHSSDIEIFSSTSKGAMQGYGYQYHGNPNYGPNWPRLMRIVSVDRLSIHNLALVDAPSFHLTFIDCTNGEVYNLIIKGGNKGGLDGIDVSGTNMWIHDVAVTNKDECVTVKNVAKNFLIEQIYCNWSGGCAMGSLSNGISIQNVHYRNIYTWSSNQMYMIKSNGGDGLVQNVLLENFIGHNNAYSLDIDQYWGNQASGNGVKLNNIQIKNWKGTESNGGARGPIKIDCSDRVPCTGITITDFAMWTETGNSQKYTCRSAYGSGFCLKGGSGGAYSTITQTTNSAPAGYSAPYMSDDIKNPIPLNQQIPIPAIPNSFFPGTSRLKP